MNRLHISSAQLSPNICNVGNSQCNFGSQTLYNSHQDNPNNLTNNKSKLTYYDLSLTPQIINFYNRESELQTLSNWIFNQNIRLISVLGLSGIGKTALVKRFVDLNLDKFEVIIWKNLKLTPSLNQIITEILTTVETSEVFKTSEVCQLLNLLKEKRCLIILDDVQNIFLKRYC